ncbi:MAG: tartrate dehydrogenase [Phycisphaeraceae bacterium]|nr:tartrate dehydrogenase [Phycisphaeraceae bacterium]
MPTHKIALYPGDGIGIEVLDAAVRVLDHLQSTAGDLALEYERFDWGCDHHDRHGVAAPEDMLDVLRGFDAIFLGAIGFPSRLADHISLEPLIRIRQAFDQFACVRPARVMDGVQSLLANPGKIDMAVVRENSEGEYISMGGVYKTDRPEEVAIQTAIHTRKGIERILGFGFDLARKRRRRLTMITKSNAQRFGMVLWDRVLESVRGDYADVECDKLHIDAAAMDFVRRPDRFDVVVASNLFGDILTDLSGAITGSLGLNPSANLDPTRRHPSLFEPVHGSAPDIAGKGVANPVGAIQSAAMMLDWLGESDAARRIQSAVEGALAAGESTPDVGGTLGTEGMTDRIIERL